MTNNHGACALTRAGGSLYTIKLKSACRKPDLSLAGLDPVPLSKIGIRLLASLGSKGENRNSRACLRNAGSYLAESYCTYCRLGGPVAQQQLKAAAVFTRESTTTEHEQEHEQEHAK